MHRMVFAASFFLWIGITANAQAGEEFYLLMFGSQRVPNNPNYSHTFATFVKLSWPGSGPCPPNARLEHHTISWLPVNMKVRVEALLPEPGFNFDLPSTLYAAHSTDQRVSMWGPYRIQADLYQRGLQRKAELESGGVRYKADDAGYRSDKASNCIHAVSTVVEGERVRVLSPGWGESASFFVLREMEPWVISKQRVSWIASALELDKFPIIYRDWTNPRSNAVSGPTFRLLGGERALQATYGPPEAGLMDVTPRPSRSRIWQQK